MRTINFTNETQDYHYACKGDTDIVVTYTGTESVVSCEIHRELDGAIHNTGDIVLVDGVATFILPYSMLDYGNTGLVLNFTKESELTPFLKGEIKIQRRF